MQIGNFDEALDKIIGKDSRYTRDAYLFVREALDYTQKRLAKTQREKEARESRESAAASAGASSTKSAEAGEEKPNHVSGQELLSGIRALAIEQFGPMALAVLEEWGVRRCEDFGEIVFNMVDNNLLAKTTEDSRDDFKGGYNFDDAFRQPFQPLARKKSPEQPAPNSTKA